MSGTTPVDNAVDTKSDSITITENGALPRGTINLGRGSIAVIVTNGNVSVTIPRLLPPASKLSREEDS